MRTLNQLIIGGLMCFTPIVASANWVEVTGKAYIENDNVELARQNAIDDALLNADFKYGVHVSNQYEIKDGKLVNATSTSNQRTRESTEFELTDEDVDGDELSVDIRVFVDGLTLNNEPKSLYKSRIFVPQTIVTQPQQLTYGQIHGIGRSLSKKLATSIDQQAKAAFSESYPDDKLNFAPSKSHTNDQRLPQWLGTKTEAQYVLIPELIDVSVEHESPFGMFSSTTRQFAIQLSLFHAISGEKVWNKSYRTASEWEFDRNEIVSTTSNRFWASEYGKKVSRVLQQVARDLGRLVTDRPLMGQIIAKKQNQLLLNVGRNHGLNVNDTLNVILKRDLPDRLQAIRIIAESSNAKVTVKQLTEDTALVSWSNHNIIENVQIGDIAIAM